MNEKEGYYVSVFYVFMMGLGLEVQAEESTNKGRIDMTVRMDDTVYVIEFKVDSPGALGQIKEKGYHEKYREQGKRVYLVGIEFGSREKNIAHMDWEFYD